MVLGGLRRCEVLGLHLGDLRFGECKVLVTEGKGGHERLGPLSPTFFETVARYLDHERPRRRDERRAVRRVEGAPARGAAVGPRTRRDRPRSARSRRAQ